ncbi:hypothetical protein TNCV_4650021 [Trichonephila clavipes]|nr:hypothetical protein TNCV_4650021 [Trichonephila clavipes]
MLNEDQNADEVKSASQIELKNMAKNGYQKCFNELYKSWKNCVVILKGLISNKDVFQQFNWRVTLKVMWDFNEPMLQSLKSQTCGQDGLSRLYSIIIDLDSRTMRNCSTTSIRMNSATTSEAPWTVRT